MDLKGCVSNFEVKFIIWGDVERCSLLDGMTADEGMWKDVVGTFLTFSTRIF